MGVGVVEVASKECLKRKKREDDRRKIDVILMNEGVVVVVTGVTPWRLSVAEDELVNIAFMEILCV